MPAPEPLDLPGGEAEVAAELQLSLPQPLDLALCRHVLTQQLQLVTLQPRHLLQQHTGGIGGGFVDIMVDTLEKVMPIRT